MIADSRSIKGVLQLQCYRDLQNGSYIESHDNMIVVNTESLPFEIIHVYFFLSFHWPQHQDVEPTIAIIEK